MKGTPALALAPMEGVIDAPMRVFLSETCTFDWCVSEFIRVSQDPVPPKVFFRHVPELLVGARTPSGTPVQVQLLGGNPELLAESAREAISCGAMGIDLNFGCPAPTVNRHDGGASLLRYPARIRSIVEAVRAAVPIQYPVSAKLRLGWDDPTQIHLNADCAAEAGASWITIHGRTKMQAYQPPADWRPMGEVRRRISEGRGGIPVVANGDLFTVEDLLRCQDISGCEHFMLGRGVLADLSLFSSAGRLLGLAVKESSPRESLGGRLNAWAPHLERFAQIAQELARRSDRGSGYALRRLKQWLNRASLLVPIPWFSELKRAQTLDEFLELLRAMLQSQER